MNKLILTGEMRSKGNLPTKYLLYDASTKNIRVLTGKECLELMNSGVRIVGFKAGNSKPRKDKYYFKHTGLVGEEGTEEVWTIVKSIVYLNSKAYLLISQVGKERTMLEEKLKDSLNNGLKVNGVKSKESGLIIHPDIEAIVKY